MSTLELPRAPRTLWVLSSPRQTFRELAQASGSPPRGYNLLFFWLALELSLAYPHLLASSLRLLFTTPGAGLMSLYATYVRYAIGPVVGMFVLGLGAYYRLRARGLPRDVWQCTSVLGYAWVPHLLLVALSALLAGLGVDSALLLHEGYTSASLTPALGAVKALLEFGPTAALAWVGASALVGRASPLPVSHRERSRAWGVAAASSLVLMTSATLIAHELRERWQELAPVGRGASLPPFTLFTLDGARLERGDFTGKVTLVDFWATWCPPCVAGLPRLEELHRDLGARGFELLSVNVEPEDPEGVRRFATEQALSFPIYIDRGLMQSRLHVHTLPTSYVVDRHGVVRDVHIGNPSFTKLRAELEALLAEER